jgi:hypothetical protein
MNRVVAAMIAGGLQARPDRARLVVLALVYRLAGVWESARSSKREGGQSPAATASRANSGSDFAPVRFMISAR